MPKYAWSWNDDPDTPFNCSFDSVETCIRDAIDSMMDEPLSLDRVIYIGECTPFVPHVDVFHLLEKLEYDVSDEIGDTAYDYFAFNSITDIPKLVALEQKLTPIVHQWLKDNGTYPDFTQIVNITPYRLADYPYIRMRKEEPREP